MLMRVGILTREYPPEVYGGAGVHVEYLTRELSRHVDVAVHCFGAPRESALVAGTYRPWAALSDVALQTMSVDLAMAQHLGNTDLVHSHTWYANLAGHLAKLLWDIPHVCTTHSLEPLRPWKAEQLGGGYALSCFCEETALQAADAVIAVSQEMRRDVLACYPAIDHAKVTVIHNGIDPDEYRPDGGTDVLERRGIDPSRSSVVFVGRVTRQKGIVHLLEAAPEIDSSAQLVIIAGAADTEELAAEVRALHARAQERRGNIIWVEEMLPRADVIQVLSHATVFVCPSIYEPFGLVNLEAMACGSAVVASAVGGIPEIVVDGETGYLVPCDIRVDDPDPAAARRFASDLAQRINALIAERDRAAAFGRAGRQRVVEHFSWESVAARTAELYRRLLPSSPDQVVRGRA
jgi:alpha-maltose-1-phosphate synthase